jgi:hypothetical protein
MQVSTGVSPEEEIRDPSQLFDSYRARIGYQQLVRDRVRTDAYSGYSRNELSAGRYRDDLNISLGFEYRF